MIQDFFTYTEFQNKTQQKGVWRAETDKIINKNRHT